jgi:AraC-like DNA-binding protein
MDWGEPVSRCWRLRDAIRTFCALYAREISFVELGLAFDAGQAWLWRRRDLPAKDPSGELHGEQFMLGSMIQVVRMAAGCQWAPPAIRLESRSSDWVLRATGLEDSRASFGGPVLAIAVPYDLLDRRLRRAASAETAPAREGTKVLAADDFAGSLHQALAPFANETSLSLELGAEIANTSPRTLRRWLALQGTSWRQIVDRVRFETCERRILESSLTITEISATRIRPTSRAPFTAGRVKRPAPTVAEG